MADDKHITNRDLLVQIVSGMTQQGRSLRSLKSHFENHLTEHREDLKTKLRYQRTIKLIILSATLTATGSFIVGLFLLFAK